MSGPVILALPGNETLAAEIAAEAGAQLGTLETRRFPDGETYLRLLSDVAGRDVILVCTLADPDPLVLRLIFAARTARERGAARIILVAPYLAYMRQDQAFHAGEAVTSVQFAALLSAEIDRLVTVDPHLHRHKALGEIYGVPAEALHAAPLLSAWIRTHVAAPLIVGPDSESEQWASAIAAGAPAVVLRKKRRGDREVEIAFPDLAPFAGRQPVLVDDIASSGRTLVMACQGLQQRGFPQPICVVVHPLFAENAFDRLRTVSAQIVSTNTVPHPTNTISVAALLASSLRD
ncbi:MAG TPA: ribose-phosphate diphosphokinase [Phenylobacterium sp.]|uniref:ribose-phosphate diphosphokinase n=1 Tax=Phenylobacterium sp. TaxID=1871053 RepID=UPI002B48EAF5|nr:ribose-phosphate diphosphokinase [Phenylobacterium sp.]HKR88000.1 ribose-phosphate diphosphokinase [Phenylobacterium sp.]